jgi:3-methyl-2-oxobutanoate hydroxymethyltransferase
MSSHPVQGSAAHLTSDHLPVTLPRLLEKKALGEPLVMVTAYDFPSALAADKAGVDLVLVGDSGAMTVLGYDSTVPVTLEELLVLAKAVRRGLRTPFMVGDLPFGSYEVSDEQAISTAMRFVKEAGCDAVKLEGGGPTSVARARAIVSAGIPVMGHVGLTPQTATALGGYRAQGRTATAAERVAREALALQEAGCFSIVFEAIPSAVAAEIMLPRPAGHPRGPRGQVRAALRRHPGRDGGRRDRVRGRRALPPLPGPGARLHHGRGGAGRVPLAACGHVTTAQRRFHLRCRAWPACPRSSPRATASSSTCSRSRPPTSRARPTSSTR